MTYLIEIITWSHTIISMVWSIPNNTKCKLFVLGIIDLKQ